MTLSPLRYWTDCFKTNLSFWRGLSSSAWVDWWILLPIRANWCLVQGCHFDGSVCDFFNGRWDLVASFKVERSAFFWVKSAGKILWRIWLASDNGWFFALTVDSFQACLRNTEFGVSQPELDLANWWQLITISNDENFTSRGNIWEKLIG